MVPVIVHKFKMICIKGRKPNVGNTDRDKTQSLPRVVYPELSVFDRQLWVEIGIKQCI